MLNTLYVCPSQENPQFEKMMYRINRGTITFYVKNGTKMSPIMSNVMQKHQKMALSQ
jgi:hypothetical protein